MGEVDLSSGAKIRTRTVVELMKVVAALGSTLPLISTLLVVKKLAPPIYTSWKKEPCSAAGGDIAVTVGTPELPMVIPNVPDSVGSASDVAVMVMAPGGVGGAV